MGDSCWRNRLCIFSAAGYTLPGTHWQAEPLLDNSDLLRLVYALGLLLLIVPGVIYGLRSRREALRYAVIWIALFGAVAVVVWLLMRTQPL